jgi:tetratricopeptide (TPR) repeat protein
MREFKRGALFCAFVLSVLSTGCRMHRVVLSAPKISAEASNLVAQGDASFRDAHLYGWREAESLYKKAYSIGPSDEIRRKLLLTRFLILTRQIDEDIPYASGDDVIKDLCAGDPCEKNLCSIAEWIKNGRKAGRLKLDGPVFQGLDPATESYINLLLFQATPRIDAFPDIFNSHRESPLFLYLNTEKLTSMDPAEFEKNYPQFAEGFEYLGEYFFQKKKYRSARACYEKAINLIPEYVNALVGLGNIYFYALEDYPQAMRYYDMALKRDPSSAAALFDKSLVLQQLGDYSGSNAVLDRMLAGNLARNKWIDGVPDAQYYQGEANYLKAYNYYLMKSAGQSRELVDTAGKFLPDSPGIIYLSGLLFYESKNLEPARRDFQRVAQMGTQNCNAQLNLGFIYEQLKNTNGSKPVPGDKESAETKSLQYFAAGGGCMEAVIGSLSHQIGMLNSTDLDPGERAALKIRLERKLADMRLSSRSTIEMIIDRVSNSSAPKKEVFLNYLKEILSRLGTQ